MPTLEELRRENKKLIAQAEARKDIEKIGMERNRLMRENVKLRHPGFYEFKRKAGFFGKAAKELAVGAGKGIKKSYKGYAEKQKKKPAKKSKWDNINRLKVEDII